MPSNRQRQEGNKLHESTVLFCSVLSVGWTVDGHLNCTTHSSSAHSIGLLYTHHIVMGVSFSLPRPHFRQAQHPPRPPGLSGAPLPVPACRRGPSPAPPNSTCRSAAPAPAALVLSCLTLRADDSATSAIKYMSENVILYSSSYRALSTSSSGQLLHGHNLFYFSTCSPVRVAHTDLLFPPSFSQALPAQCGRQGCRSPSRARALWRSMGGRDVVRDGDSSTEKGWSGTATAVRESSRC
jgi:hypothetical protein